MCVIAPSAQPLDCDGSSDSGISYIQMPNNNLQNGSVAYRDNHVSRTIIIMDMINVCRNIFTEDWKGVHFVMSHCSGWAFVQFVLFHSLVLQIDRVALDLHGLEWFSIASKWIKHKISAYKIQCTWSIEYHCIQKRMALNAIGSE